MKLECAQSISSNHASVEDIKNAFADDKGRGEFIILSSEDGSFIQAAGEFDGPYVLQYRDASTDKQFAAVGTFTKDQIESAFLSYLTGDSAWHDSKTWTEVNQENFSTTIVIVLAIVAVAIAIAYFAM